MLATPAPAYDPADLERLELCRECKGCDLSGAELPYSAFKNIELTGANLRDANLDGVDFYSAIMVDVDLIGAGKLGDITVGEAVLCRTTPDGGIENRDCK